MSRIVRTAQKPLTFDEFLAQYPEDGGRYELIGGEIVEMRPIGEHELISSFLSEEFSLEIRRLLLPYVSSRNTLVKTDRPYDGDLPDVIVLDKTNLKDDPYWQKSSTISRGTSAKLVVEVVSTNWGDDYGHKLTDYERVGIPEYWIVDYLGLGAKRYIGSPKQPTLSIYQLVEGEYQVQQFRGADRIESMIFPELVLTAEEVFQVGE